MLQSALVINLDRRPDRLAAVMKYYTDSDLASVPVYRLPAHDGSKITYTNGLVTPTAVAELEQLKFKGVRDFHAQLSVGAIGCYLSHVDAWRWVAEHGAAHPDQPYLILEDDARIPPKAMDAIQTGWALAMEESAGKPFLLLGHIICLAGCGVLSNGLVAPERFWSFQAYFLNAKTASALLSMGLFPMDVQIDSQVLYFRNMGLLNIYWYDIMVSGPTDTDIQVSIRRNAPLDRFIV